MEKKMLLCGTGIPLEFLKHEKVAANRIENCSKYFIDTVKYEDYKKTFGLFESMISDSNGIMSAIKKGNPCGIDKKPIDRITVKKELLLLSICLLKTKHAVKQKVISTTSKQPMLKQITIINSLAYEMLLEGLGIGDNSHLHLMLMAKTDRSSILGLIPGDVHETIAKIVLDLHINDMEKIV